MSKRGIAVTLAGLALTSAGCGRESAFQYIEVPDGQTYAKVPADWTIDSQGWVDFAFADIKDLALLPGDNPIAWSARFNGDDDGELPRGEIQVQTVDARQRGAFLLGPLLGPRNGAEELSWIRVKVGDLTGWRARQRDEHDGTPWLTEHLILTDERRSTTYYIGIQCTEECFERHVDEIEEVLTTFRVES